MNTISSLGMTTQQATQQTVFNTSTQTSQEVSKSEFLKLLVAQLQNQDPLNPVDNQQFIAQLATFSSLEQLISINQGITKLVGASEETGSTSTSA